MIIQLLSNIINRYLMIIQYYYPILYVYIYIIHLPHKEHPTAPDFNPKTSRFEPRSKPWRR